MAKVAFTIRLETENPRNLLVEEMRKQGLGQRVMRDRRLRRQNRKSWKKDEAKAW